jgi:two-component system, cell cycle sensor histidine kinase and response regulator CckA
MTSNNTQKNDELKKVLEGLRISEEKYRNVFKTAIDCLYITALDGKIIEINDAGVALFGYESMEELLCVPVTELYADTSARQELMEKIEREGWASNHPVQFRKKNGVIIESLLTALPIKSDAGDIIGYQGCIHDITHLKQVEAEKEAIAAELKRAQKMEVIAMLAGGVAHDFNNLLFAIMGNVELAKLKATGSQVQQLDRALDACMDAKNLLAQFVELTAGSMSAKAPGSIAQVIRESVATRVKLKSHIIYELHLTENLKPVAFVVEQMLLAISHLLSNAEDAMPGGGILSISAENITLSEKKVLNASTLHPGAYVKISISDQGDGIPAEILERIFDPYFSTKHRPAEKGRGLGLTIVYAIVKRHKGHIVFESRPKAGTMVIVYMPAA